MFLILDGIDGSGKSTVISAWIDYLASQNKKVFNLKDYWMEHHTHPTVDELKNFDVIISAEPTYVWTGASIRQEMITRGTNYSPSSIAEAYALDRLVLYKRLLLPLRALNKLIIQDRSVSTSLCYQPLQNNSNLTLEDVAKIEGNNFALNNAPDYLIITDISVENSLKRLSARSEKRDNSIFEKETFLTKARARFLDPEYQKYFTDHHTKIHILNCNENIAIMKQQALDLLTNLSITTL